MSSDAEFTDDEQPSDSQERDPATAFPTQPTDGNEVDPATAALKKLYGTEAKWRDTYQHDLITASLQLESKTGLLAVLPTGYGKSLLFIIPAIVEANAMMVTVVFVPLRALMATLAASIREKGIHCTVWGEQNNENPHVISLLLASCDSYERNPLLKRFITRLESEKRLARIVLDEAHLIVSATYRIHALQKIAGVRNCNTPVILLTGSLPPDLEQELLRIMCFGPSNCTTWRLPTVRSNIRYLLERPATHQVAQASLSGIVRDPRRPAVPGGWFKEWSQYMDDKEQGIIFCVTTEEVDEIANCHQLLQYHSKMDADIRKRNLSKWSAGLARWIVGTSGLGAGIDVAKVKVVVHWGIPTDILEWVQMAGRGGRGIEWSYSITVEPQKPVFQRQSIYRAAEETHPDRRQMMLDIISSKECIRPLLSTFLDGIATSHTCSERHMELCWICTTNVLPSGASNRSSKSKASSSRMTVPTHPTSLHPKPHPTTMQQSRQQDGASLGFIVEVLRRWGEGCTYCHILGEFNKPGVYPDHTTNACGRWRGDSGVSWNKLWSREVGMRRALRFDAGTCCFRCGCPKSICQQGNRDGSHANCDHSKVFMDAAFAASHLESIRLAVNESLKVNRRMEMQEFWETLGKEWMWGRERCTRMMLVVVTAARHVGLEALYLETGYVV